MQWSTNEQTDRQTWKQEGGLLQVMFWEPVLLAMHGHWNLPSYGLIEIPPTLRPSLKAKQTNKNVYCSVNSDGKGHLGLLQSSLMDAYPVGEFRWLTGKWISSPSPYKSLFLAIYSGCFWLHHECQSLPASSLLLSAASVPFFSFPTQTSLSEGLVLRISLCHISDTT